MYEFQQTLAQLFHKSLKSTGMYLNPNVFTSGQTILKEISEYELLLDYNPFIQSGTRLTDSFSLIS